MEEEKENVINNNKETFITLKRLQNLYEKESALKDIFSKIINEKESEIQTQCQKLIKEKIEILNLYENLESPENERKNFLLLTDDQKYFGGLDKKIKKFLLELWEQPKFVANLIINSKIEEIKDFSPFIMDNFYQNFLSSKNLENNLLYVLFILLKNEINNLSTYKDFNNFLSNSPCGFFLQHLIKIEDINIYFKNTLYDIFEKIEILTKNKKLLYEVTQSENTNTKELEDKKNQEIHTESLILDLTISSKKDNEIIFVSKQILQDFMIKSDNQMREYCFLQMSKFQEDSNIYSFETEINIFKNGNLKKQKIFKEIKQHIILIKYFIEKIIHNLINNIRTLPYEIKFISKIISVLLIKKFPKINKVEENAFISKFFFHILLRSVFNSPLTTMLINDFMISKNTSKNLETISSIIFQLVSGNFYTADKHKILTTFNHFFLNQMPLIFYFFEKLSKVELPPFIEKLLKEEKNYNYNYNYFKENEEQFINCRSILYNASNVWYLLENINNNKEKLFIDKSTEQIKKLYEELFVDDRNNEFLKNLSNLENRNYEKIMKQITNDKNQIQNIEINGKKFIKLFFIIDLLYNEKYNKLIKQKEIIEEGNNNISKISNYFGLILKNYVHLSEIYYDLNIENDLITILEQMKSIIKYPHCNENKFPIKWYICELIDSLSKIENNLKENDFKLLLKELENSLISKIKSYNIDELTTCFNLLKYLNPYILYHEKVNNILNEIDLNQKVENLIEKERICVEITFKYKKKTKELKIEKTSKKQQHNLKNDKAFDEDDKKVYCDNIESFIQNFPSLRKYQIYQDINLFEIQKQLQIPQKLEIYFSLIEEYLSNNYRISDEKKDKNILNKIKDKIRDYVMNKLFSKIFPIDSSNADNKIFQMSMSLSWVKPHHFINNLDSLYEIVLPEIIKYLTQIDIEESLPKKIFYMSKIFKEMNDLLKFNNDYNNENYNNEVNNVKYMEILTYSFIKAKLTNIHTNLEYMELYIKNENEKVQLNILMNICDKIKNMKASDLNGISADEFDKKCKEAIMNN